MKPIYGYFAAAIAFAFTLAACVPSAPERAPPPRPAPIAAPTPTAAPPSIVRPAPENWIDAPQTPGNWFYDKANSAALFGKSRNNALFSLRCDRARDAIILARAASGNPPEIMTIRTEKAERFFNVQPVAGQSADLAASVQARDPILDAMALTRGRFAVEMVGAPTLYLPAWAEVTRVIEDCR